MRTIITYFVALVMALPALSQIRSQQTLQISIQGVPQSEQSRLNAVYQVSGSGTIDMWEIGTIRAAGRSPSELATTIAAAYKAKGIYANPTFQVIVPDSERVNIAKMVTIGGEVRSSGAKPFIDGMTIYDAVANAGGPTPFGAMNRVKLYRNAKVYTYNLNTDEHRRVRLYPDDKIDVPQKNALGR